MNVAIMTSGVLPVPAVKGGAVEALDDFLIRMNEEFAEIRIEIISIYDQQAEEWSRNYCKSTFVFIHIPLIIQLVDKLIYWGAKHIMKKAKHMSNRYILQRLYFIYRAGQLFHERDYDRVIIENHATLFMALKSHKNFVKYKDRYYYHLHNEVRNSYGCADIIKGCKKILAVSNFINRSLSDFLNGMDISKLAVLRNCTDLEKFSFTSDMERLLQLKHKYGICDNDRVLVFAGRLSKEKGARELLLAFKKLNDPHVKLLIAGSYFFDSGMYSSYEIELHSLAKEMKENIIFTGFIPYSEMPSIYALADIVVIPSIWNDPAPLTVVETLATGRPLITTRSGGIPEYVNDDCAIILDRDDQLVDNLYQEIKDLLKDDNRRQQMSGMALKTAQDLSIERYYKEFIEMIR